MSQIFIGIYRESYGWVAPDMEISGVEDEFQIALGRGMDCLLYVYENPANRDARLEALVQKAKTTGLTLAYYSELDQLGERVRNDVTALISERFVGQALVSHETPSPKDVLDAVLPDPHHRFRRSKVESSILSQLRQTKRLVVASPLGGGKTVLLAQLSIANDWLFVDGQGLTRLDLVARVANSLRQRLGMRPATLHTEQSAIRELAKQWRELQDVTLAIDSADDPEIFWNLAGSDRPLVLTSRMAFEVSPSERFVVPMLDRHEIESWVSVLRGSRPQSDELDRLVESSGGNPLYLRFFALGADSSTDLSLRELEIQSVRALLPRAREVISYLALSPVTLSLGDLHTLVENEGGPEALVQQMSAADRLLKQPGGSFQLIHDHLRETLLDQLRGSPGRMAFFAGRLGRYFENAGQYVASVLVYLEAGEERLADRVLDRAAYQAALMGGGAPAVPIFRRQVEVARELGKGERELFYLLDLAYAHKQTGALEDAQRALADARGVATRNRDPGQLLRVQEVELLIESGVRPRAERVRKLEALQGAYLDAGDGFNAARVGTIEAFEYVSGGEYEKAETVSRESLRVFSELGDRFGMRTARVNLAAALSGMPDREAEGVAIAQELERDLEPRDYPRERAVLCNLLTRHYRQRGETDRAAVFALEAIEIGEKLNDQRVIAINRANLGNIRRDEGELDQALEAYRAAERAAVEGGLAESEASANELIASVLNQQEKYGRAVHHAQHAAALAQSLGDRLLIARAEEERAVALRGQREVESATEAYICASLAVRSYPSGRSLFESLVGDALALCNSSRRLDLKLRVLREIFSHELEEAAAEGGVGGGPIEPLQVLYEALPRIARSISVGELLPVVALSVGDLFSVLPPAVAQKVAVELPGTLIKNEYDSPSDSVLAAVAAVLLTHSTEYLTIQDLVVLAERLSDVSSRLHFKPHSDGAAHWTVGSEIAGGVIVTIMQLDDLPATARVGMILALLLASLGLFWRTELIGTEDAPRHEAIINITSRGEFEAHIGPDILELGDMRNGFVVSESTDLSRVDQPPIAVILTDGFPIPWRPNEHALSDVHLLLGGLLRALSAHLLAKAVEPEVLFPKIGGIIREIGFGGSADSIHPRAGP